MTLIAIFLFTLGLSDSYSVLSTRKNWDMRAFGSKFEFQLVDAYSVDYFLGQYAFNPNIQGVFLLSKNDTVQFVGSSNNIVGAVREFSGKHDDISDNIRVQTFSVYDDDFVKAYVLELIKQTKPVLNAEDDAQIFEKLGGEIDDRGEMDSLRDALGIFPSIDESEILSPFEGLNNAKAQQPAPKVSEMELNFVNVDKVLDEIRPYLIADGGNVAIVSIDEQTRDIRLALKGACGSCPSSTVIR